MKKLILFIVLLTSGNTFSQNLKTVEVSNDTTIYEEVDDDPVFPGGHFAVFDSINVYLNNDEIFKDRKIDGEVKIEFVVEKDGTTRYYKVLKSLDPVYDAELIKMFMKMPVWTPAILQDKKVRFKKVFSLKLSINSF